MKEHEHEYIYGVLWQSLKLSLAFRCRQMCVL